jgi:hypothetical protein
MARDIYRGQRTPGNPNLNNWAKERELLTPEQIEQAKYVGFWHLPDETRRVEPGGWWGGRNWNRERFCRTLYTVLYKAADGFLRPATLLERIWWVGGDSAGVELFHFLHITSSGTNTA